MERTPGTESVPLLAKYNLLHNSQNAYMRNKGCKDATIQIINALEEAEQAETLIALSSWDFTRAFDSVSHVASKLSHVTSKLNSAYHPLYVQRWSTTMQGRKFSLRALWQSHTGPNTSSRMARPPLTPTLTPSTPLHLHS